MQHVTTGKAAQSLAASLFFVRPLAQEKAAPHTLDMNNALNNRLSVLTSYYAGIDAEIEVQKCIVDTYLGLLAQGADVEQFLARTYGEIAALKADRREIDNMWNEALLAAEEAA